MHKDVVTVKGFVDDLSCLTEESTNKKYKLSNYSASIGKVDYGYFLLKPDFFWTDKWYFIRKIITESTKK